MSKHLVGSLRAALSIALFAGAGSVFAVDNVATLVGGDVVSGDQATVALDSAVTNAFSYSNGNVTAYLNAHVFCAETPRAQSQVSLQPRYQLPALVGNDVWKFPDVYVHSLTYQRSGTQNAGSPAILIGQAADAFNKQFRCLTSHPRSNFAFPTAVDFPNVSQGLFDSGFGGNMIPLPPSGPSQNVTVSALTFNDFLPSMAVSVVKIDTQFDVTSPAGVVWTLVDGFNTSALSPSADATWCELPATWDEQVDSPPPQLCDDAVLNGVIKEVGPFVRHQFSAQPSSPAPHFVLVYRPVVGAAAAGTPTQGFAALRTGGGMAGVAEESQDWFTDDSVWYNY